LQAAALLSGYFSFAGAAAELLAHVFACLRVFAPLAPILSRDARQVRL
jgi:hypothetical protein